jgi:hypothetical protein
MTPLARRNLTDGWKIELELGNKQDLLEIGRQREAMGGGDKKSAAAKSGLSKNDKPDPPHNTRAIIAESRGALHRSASAISKTAPCIYTGSGTIRSAKRRA